MAFKKFKSSAGCLQFLKQRIEKIQKTIRLDLRIYWI